MSENREFSGAALISEGRQRTESDYPSGTTGEAKHALDEIRNPNRPWIESAQNASVEPQSEPSSHKKSFMERFREKRSSQATLPSHEAEDTKLYNLQPVTQDQDARYKQEAAGGYTPIQVEQGKPYFDAVREKKDAEEALAKANAGLDQVRSQYKKDAAGSSSVTPEPQSPKESVKSPITLEQLRSHFKSAMTLDELYQAGQTDANGMPISREEAQAAAWNRVQAANESGNESQSVPAESNQPEENKWDLDSITTRLDAIYAKKTDSDKANRHLVRTPRKKLFEDVVANASEDVQYQLAVKDRAFRERYIDNKFKEFEDANGASYAIENVSELRRQICKESGEFTDEKLKKNIRDWRRKQYAKYGMTRALGRDKKNVAPVNETGTTEVPEQNFTPVNETGTTEVPEQNFTPVNTGEIGLENNKDSIIKIEERVKAKLDDIDGKTPRTGADSIVKSSMRRRSKKILVAAAVLLALLPIKGGDNNADAQRTPPEWFNPTAVTLEVATPTAEKPVDYVVVDETATVAPTETATVAPTETATVAPTETSEVLSSTVETSVESVDAKDVETILSGSVVLNIDRSGDSVSQSMLDEQGLSLQEYSDNYYTQWDVASATCLVNWSELEAAWASDGMPISRADYIAVWEKAQSGDKEAQDTLVYWSNTLLDRQQVGQHPVEFSTPDQAREANTILYTHFTENSDQFTTFLNEVQQGREDKVQQFVTVEASAQAAPGVAQSGQEQGTKAASRGLFSRLFNRR